jgi:hypothetical protein
MRTLNKGIVFRNSIVTRGKHDLRTRDYRHVTATREPIMSTIVCSFEFCQDGCNWPLGCKPPSHLIFTLTFTPYRFFVLLGNSDLSLISLSWMDSRGIPPI